MNDYLSNIDIYEVDKEDYDSYVYRCRNRETMKLTPKKGFTIWQDLETKIWLYGEHEEIVMEMPHKNFYIFELMKEEELASPKLTKHIQLQYEEWLKFIKVLKEQNKHD